MAELNILVTRGQPQTSSSGSGGSGWGGSSGLNGPLQWADYDRMYDEIERSQYEAYYWAWVENAKLKEEQRAKAEADAVAAAKHAEEARQNAERQAIAAAQLKARRQAEEAARQLALRQAEEALREYTRRVTLDAEKSAELAESRKQRIDAEAYVKHASDAGRIWSVVAGPNNPTSQLPSSWDKANEVAKKIFIRRATAALGKQLPMLAALYPSDLASGEKAPQIFAVNASELGVGASIDLGFIANKKGTVDVTHRFMPESMAEDGRAAWAKTDGVNLGSRVRVRPVDYDPATKTYTFTRDGETTPALVWTPHAPLIDSSTSLPSVQQGASIYSGNVDALFWADYSHPEHNSEPDDYILDLPSELGLGKPYIYFKTPRRTPGFASGDGREIVGVWLGKNAAKSGAAIPAQIANELRGKRFSNFDRLRQAIWQEVAKDPVLSTQFGKWDVGLMKGGGAPYTTERERRGKREKFEIHHIHEVAKGGQVYDFSNMVIMTPNAHINHHGKSKNEPIQK